MTMAFAWVNSGLPFGPLYFEEKEQHIFYARVKVPMNKEKKRYDKLSGQAFAGCEERQATLCSTEERRRTAGTRRKLFRLDVLSGIARLYGMVQKVSAVAACHYRPADNKGRPKAWWQGISFTQGRDEYAGGCTATPSISLTWAALTPRDLWEPQRRRRPDWSESWTDVAPLESPAFKKKTWYRTHHLWF